MTKIPEGTYGVLKTDLSSQKQNKSLEEIREYGFTVLHSGYTTEKIKEISESFNLTHKNYLRIHGEDFLKRSDEQNMIRSPLVYDEDIFLKLALHPEVLSLVSKLITGKFVLNQQNGVISPSRHEYSQGQWHRDLPYQEFISNKPLAINALYCVDEFSCDNGGTFVLPKSHKKELFPKDSYVKKNAFQVKAEAGSFILMDCMLFHSGGFNDTSKDRRAVNHVYNIPYFKQQIKLPSNLNILKGELSNDHLEILGYGFEEPESVDSFLKTRRKKNKS